MRLDLRELPALLRQLDVMRGEEISRLISEAIREEVSRGSIRGRWRPLIQTAAPSRPSLKDTGVLR